MDPFIKNIIDKRIKMSSEKLQQDPVAKGVTGFAKEIYNLPGDFSRKVGGLLSNINPFATKFVSPVPNSVLAASKPAPTVTPTPTVRPTVTPTPTRMPTSTPIPIPTATPMPKKPFNLLDIFKKPTPTPTPSATPTPTATPTPRPGVVEAYPEGPSTPNRAEMYGKLQGKEANIAPAVYDAIQRNIKDDYRKRLALALARQESSGGRELYGDSDPAGNPRSFGPYHIMPGNAPYVPGWKQPTKEQAMDPEWSTKFLAAMMDYYAQKGVAPEHLLRPQDAIKQGPGWNWNSGYFGSTGPKYDKDIPRAATMSSYFRK